MIKCKYQTLSFYLIFGEGQNVQEMVFKGQIELYFLSGKINVIARLQNIAWINSLYLKPDLMFQEEFKFIEAL